MTTIAEWYRRVESTWPANVPPLSDAEAVRAIRRLFRFALGRTWQGKVRVVTGNRRTGFLRGVLDVNPNRRGMPNAGWRDVVHDFSHDVHYRLLPDVRPHGPDHARLEIRLIKEVVRRGWLDGKLRDAPAPVVSKEDARKARLVERLIRVRALGLQWERRARRAQTAIKKYRRTARAIERSLAVRTSETS